MLPMVLLAALSGLFHELCRPCHGPGGRGDGPAAHLFRPPPRDLVAGTLLAGTDRIALVGRLRAGLPGTGMPRFGVLGEAALGTLADDVLALRRGEGPPAAEPPLWPGRPLPLLPAVPAGSPPIVASLSAEHCGRCHPAQLARWRTSRHALAFGPAVDVQLGEPPDPACTACHAPLGEQQAGPTASGRLPSGGPTASGRLPSGDPTASGCPPPGDPDLRQEGVTCAVCHRRDREKVGRRPPDPTRGTGLPVRVDARHGGAELCLPCHSLPLEVAVQGRPLLDTWREWSQSAYLPARIPCQTCHFAQTDHGLGGGHDPDAVRRAVRLLLGPVAGGIEATVENVGAGHAFPTTATPRAVLRLRQLDRAGRPLPETERLWAIGRTVRSADLGRTWVEVADTRISPGEIRRWPYDVPRHGQATSVQAALYFFPDWFYANELRPRAGLGEQWAVAAAEASRSGFFVTERRWLWPAAPGPLN